MTDPPRAKCPVCGKHAMRQISGGAGLIFKGSGFYITDYGKDGKGPRQDKEAKAEAEAKSEAKAEAAPAKPEPPPSPPESSPKAGKGEKKSSKKRASS